MAGFKCPVDRLGLPSCLLASLGNDSLSKYAKMLYRHGREFISASFAGDKLDKYAAEWDDRQSEMEPTDSQHNNQAYGSPPKKILGRTCS